MTCTTRTSRALGACAALIVIVLALPTAPAAQDVQGYIDFDRSVERQIRQLEQLVGNDNSARKQVVAYQWLIELYGYLGRDDDVERCYQRILAFYPNDVGTLNRYARFLMDNRKDLPRADKTLHNAYRWARAIDARGVDQGETFALWAEVQRRMGDNERALRLTGRALDLLSEERSGDALRTKAKTLVAMERYDDAADAYLQLIAIDRAANDDDINALQLFAARTTRYAHGSLQKAIDGAVEAQRQREAERIAEEGGTLVTVQSTDGVPLEATLRHADGPGAVLFVHDTGSQRSVFTPYAQLLYIDDISSLTVDLRGHGGSRADSMLTYDALSVYNRERLPDDVVAAYRYLQHELGLDDARVAIVAEGNACAIVEKALYHERIEAPVAYLSPTFGKDDLELRTAVSFHPAQPVLLVSAREDFSALQSLELFTGPEKDATPRPGVETRLYDDAGHGVETLRRTPSALEHLQQWLRSTVGSR